MSERCEAAGARRVRLGEFTFDPATGELHQLAAGGRQERRRLAPRPARLLALLVEHQGRLVEQSTIRDCLWPDVRADVEQNIHFCVRQVRSALQDSAVEPRYVETLPRRGYRLIAAVEPLDDSHETGEGPQDADRAEPESPTTPRRRSWWWSIPATAAVAVMLGFVFLRLAPAPEKPRVSLAITSFEPPAHLGIAPEVAYVADRLLLKLGHHEHLAVVGPTTTAGFGSGRPAVRRLVKELEVDYVIHGHWIDEAEGAQLLVELIRASDGRHLWVEQFADPGAEWEAIAAAAVEGTLPIFEGLTVR